MEPTIIEYENEPFDMTVAVPSPTSAPLAPISMRTLSGSVGLGLIVPEIVKFWPGIHAVPAAGLENVIVPLDVLEALPVVDAEGVVSVGMLEIVVVVEDVVVMGGGVVVVLVLVSIAKIPKASTTRSTTAVATIGAIARLSPRLVEVQRPPVIFPAELRDNPHRCALECILIFTR